MTASATELAKEQRRGWWLFLGVMLLTLLVRGGALWVMRERLHDDPDAYRQIAENLLANGVYGRAMPLDVHADVASKVPTAYRPPLYPLLLSKLSFGGVVSLHVIAICHTLLGLVTVAIAFDLAARWGLRGVAPLAALLIACDPILINQSALVMTETLATLLAVACLWQLTRFWKHPSVLNAVGSGLLIGIAALCRPTFLVWSLPVLVVVMMWQLPVGRRIGLSASLALAVTVALSPWMLRNYVVFGELKATTTHGGYTLWLANNPSYYDWLREGKSTAWPGLTDEEQVAQVYWKSKFFIVDSDGDQNITDSAWHHYVQTQPGWFYDLELDADAEFQQRAWETIRERPGMFLYASLIRVRDLWSPLPQKTAITESTYRTIARLLVAIWYCGVYLLAVLGAWKLRGLLLRSPWIWGVTLCLAFTAVHTVYWSNLRMRAPLMPVVCLLAGAAFIRIERGHHGVSEANFIFSIR